MEVIEIKVTEDYNPFYQRMLARGAIWGCECGESFYNRAAAEHCRKCRQYLDKAPTKLYKLVQL